jgi:hypothetical protein
MWKVEMQKDKPTSRCSSVFEEFTVLVSVLITQYFCEIGTS